MDVVSPQLRRFVVLGIRFIVLSVWISLGPYLLYTTLWQRLAINVEGKVISVRDIPYPCAPPGHKSEYTFQSSDGSNSTYIATPGTNAPSLPVDYLSEPTSRSGAGTSNTCEMGRRSTISVFGLWRCGWRSGRWQLWQLALSFSEPSQAIHSLGRGITHISNPTPCASGQRREHQNQENPAH